MVSPGTGINGGIGTAMDGGKRLRDLLRRGGQYRADADPDRRPRRPQDLRPGPGAQGPRSPCSLTQGTSSACQAGPCVTVPSLAKLMVPNTEPEHACGYPRAAELHFSRRREINKPALRIGGDQFHRQPVPDVQPMPAVHQHAFHVADQRPHESAVLIHARDDGAEILPDRAGAAPRPRCASSSRAPPCAPRLPSACSAAQWHSGRSSE